MHCMYDVPTSEQCTNWVAYRGPQMLAPLPINHNRCKHINFEPERKVQCSQKNKFLPTIGPKRTLQVHVYSRQSLHTYILRL